MGKKKYNFQEKFESWVEWKLYKVLYIGVLVPLLFEKARKLLFEDFALAFFFIIIAIILVSPIIFKTLKILKLIDKNLK